jgi:hypothetical protein
MEHERKRKSSADLLSVLLFLASGAGLAHRLIHLAEIKEKDEQYTPPTSIPAGTGRGRRGGTC